MIKNKAINQNKIINRNFKIMWDSLYGVGELDIIIKDIPISTKRKLLNKYDN